MNKILYLIPSLSGGGAERQLTYLACELGRFGWEVHVAFLYSGPNLTRLRSSGAVLHEMPSIGNHNPLLLWKLWRLMNSIKPNIIQTWLVQMDVLGGVLSRLSGIPWIITERASALGYPKSVKNLLRKYLARYAIALVANSEAGMEYWKTISSQPPIRMVIPNGLPFLEIENVGAKSFSKIEIAYDQRIVLFAGRIAPQKNINNFLHALTFVLKTTDCVAIIFGDGADLTAARKIAELLLPEKKVQFKGYVSEAELWSWMKRADVFVSVSLYEGHPNAVLEAIACECPLVVSNIPEHLEILDKKNAVFVDPRNPQCIAEAIAEVLNDSVTAKLRAVRAKVASSKNSIKDTALTYDKLYRQIMSPDVGGNL